MATRRSRGESGQEDVAEQSGERLEAHAFQMQPGAWGLRTQTAASFPSHHGIQEARAEEARMQETETEERDAGNWDGGGCKELRQRRRDAGNRNEGNRFQQPGPGGRTREPWTPSTGSGGQDALWMSETRSRSQNNGEQATQSTRWSEPSPWAPPGACSRTPAPRVLPVLSVRRPLAATSSAGVEQDVQLNKILTRSGWVLRTARSFDCFKPAHRTRPPSTRRAGRTAGQASRQDRGGSLSGQQDSHEQANGPRFQVNHVWIGLRGRSAPPPPGLDAFASRSCPRGLAIFFGGRRRRPSPSFRGVKSRQPVGTVRRRPPSGAPAEFLRPRGANRGL